jgi:hypothetical protein
MSCGLSSRCSRVTAPQRSEDIAVVAGCDPLLSTPVM